MVHGFYVDRVARYHETTLGYRGLIAVGQNFCNACLLLTEKERWESKSWDTGDVRREDTILKWKNGRPGSIPTRYQVSAWAVTPCVTLWLPADYPAGLPPPPSGQMKTRTLECIPASFRAEFRSVIPLAIQQLLSCPRIQIAVSNRLVNDTKSHVVSCKGIHKSSLTQFGRFLSPSTEITLAERGGILGASFLIMVQDLTGRPASKLGKKLEQLIFTGT
ncbi:hypothetical protein FB451DRAFT_1162618 [Mycena latifolia]|nr:hypothetical protein FB451DRAFT_1162618 [Mycena latifolia]